MRLYNLITEAKKEDKIQLAKLPYKMTELAPVLSEDNIKYHYNVLTKGYKPEEHLPLLFESLCKSSNFDSETIKKVSKKVLEDYSKKTLKEISDLLKEKCNTNLYPSRLLNLGIYSIISNATDYDKINESEKQEFITDVLNDLNLSVNKAEKDIGLYKSSLTKLQQAKELLQETKLKRQKK